MTDHIEAARELLEGARNSADSEVHDHIDHVDEGLEAIVGDERTEGTPQRSDRLAELEEKLAGLEERTSGETSEQLRAVREHVDAYRREHPPTRDGE